MLQVVLGKLDAGICGGKKGTALQVRWLGHGLVECSCYKVGRKTLRINPGNRCNVVM